MRAKVEDKSGLGLIDEPLPRGATTKALQATIDALTPRFAIVDEAGRILFQSATWIGEQPSRYTAPKRLSPDRTCLRSYGIELNVSPHEISEAASQLRAVIAGDRPSFVLRHKFDQCDGPHWLETQAIRIMNEPKRVLIMHKDISDVIRAETEAEKIAALILSARDNERRRIARELHDTTVQDLITVKLSLEQLDLTMATAKILGLLDRSLSDLRAMSYLFHPPMLEDYGLLTALRSYVAGFGRRTGIGVAFEALNDLPALSPEIEQSLYYIVQEALTNIYRHSGSKVATIKLTANKRTVAIDVADRGKGMRGMRQSRAFPGVGVAGMRARARLYGGVLSIQSRRDGTTVRAVFPTG